MADVIDINENSPHGTGWTKCWRCSHDWVAVFPIVSVEHLTCPECSAQVRKPPFSQDDLEKMLIQIASSCISTMSSVVSPGNQDVSSKERNAFLRQAIRGRKTDLEIAQRYMENSCFVSDEF